MLLDLPIEVGIPGVAINGSMGLPRRAPVQRALSDTLMFWLAPTPSEQGHEGGRAVYAIGVHAPQYLKTAAGE
jgi:hypothetical protein